MHHQLGGSTEDDMNKMSVIGHISLLLIYLSRFLGEIREMWSDEFVGYTRIEIFSKASFF
jgi:hypothetical protein